MTKEMLDERRKVKKALNKLLVDFGNAYENIPDDMDDASVEQLIQLFRNTITQILSLETDTCRIRTIPKTKIVCLCGSTRFTEEMLVKQWELTKQGFVVLSWCALLEWYFTGDDKTHIGDQEGVKEIVDTIHMRKIDLADRVMVLNIGGYVGESTRREIEHAELQGKPIDYLEPVSNAGFVPEVKDDQRV